jgi:hypothetical protein
MTASDLPQDLGKLACVVDLQSPAARELFHYALVLLLVEDGKAEIIVRRTVDARERVTVRTVAGELFSIVKPDESDDMMETLKVLAREIVNAERANLSHGEADKP